MSKFKNAADTLKRAAVKYEAMMEAAKVLDEIGSLEQSASEYKAQSEAALKERDLNLDEAVKVKEQVKKAKADAAEILAKAEDKAALIFANAQNKSESMREAAIQAADNARSNALAETQSMINTMEVQIKSMQEARSTLADEIEGLMKTRVETEALATLAEKRLAKVKEAITKLAE